MSRRGQRGSVGEAVSASRQAWAGVLLVVGLGMLSGLITVPTDVAEYAHYAYEALGHPGMAWPREYPPLALVLFVVPRLVPFDYMVTFPLWAGAALTALVAYGIRVLGASWGTTLLWYLLLGAAALATNRYDIFPAGCLAVGVMAADQGQWNRAWGWTTLGAALKVFPLVAWPVLLVAEWRATGRVAVWRPIAALAVLAASYGFPLLFGVPTLSWLGFLNARPPNVGSLAGEMAAVLDPRYQMYASFGSVDVVAPVASLLAPALTGLGMASALAVYVLYARGTISAVQAVTGALTAVILGSKVFSVQYLMWLMPLWAWSPLNRDYGIVALANTASYPLLFSLYTGNPALFGPMLLGLLGFRNVTLAVATVRVLRRETQLAESAGVSGMAVNRSG